MREIKFRAWSVHNKAMYPQAGEGGVATFAINPDGTTQTYGIYTKLELMQYTGLKDKNDKEIYEGDIIHWKFMPTTINAQVIFELGRFVLDYPNNGDSYIPANSEEVEVIGNIYENKELLKGAEK